MYLAIDVGGTKTLLATFAGSGEIKNQVKFPTPVEYQDFIPQLKDHIAEVCADEKPESCTIALPGVLDREAGVAFSFGNLPWENVSIGPDLSETLQCPIFLENDAKLAALAEANAVREIYRRVLYVTVSTGIGFALVVDNKIDYSIQDASGHAVMLEHGGKIMSWEEFASGKAIVSHTGKRASEITDEKDWYIIARNLALELIDLIVTLTPDCVVIGGGVGTHLPKFQEHLHEELEIYRNKMVASLPPVLQAKHPEEAVIYGGYLLCRQHDT